MRLPAATLSVALASYVLLSCSQQDAAIDFDPKLGQNCFEMQRAALPVGTQYEGIDGVDTHSIRIRIMDGTGVTTVECGLDPDGTLRSTGE